MADYIYLLQTRLNASQRASLEHVRNTARTRGMTVFLVGGAVRDLTTGSPVRDLDFAVQGNALKLRKDLEKTGGVVVGEDPDGQSVFLTYPGGVRVEVGSTLTASYPKPGKPVYEPATILDDLRHRDFTVNSMAISLNEGSFGLLMDPLNGIADLENRELRLVSNYGFIEDPSLLIRAARLTSRLGWTLEEKTQQRYETAKTEGYISALHPFNKSYELEEIFHEEDPMPVLRHLEAEGWTKVLFPAWTSKHVNENEVEKLRDLMGQLELVGIHPDPSAALFPLLTAKLQPKEVNDLKKAFARPGFVDQIAALDNASKAFGTQLTAKEYAAPSAAWKLLYESEPEPILWLAHTGKGAAIQNKFKAFFTEWPTARQRIPYQLMQEMRIVPELPIYGELIEKLFFAIMDKQLETPETTRAFLEPYSPPAPPPPVNARRRPVKREAKPAKRAKKVVAVETVDGEAAVSAETAAPAVPAKAAAPTKAAAPAKAVPAKAAAPAKTAPVAAKKTAPVPAKKAIPAPAKKATPAKAVKKAPVKASKPAAKKAPAKAAKSATKKVAPKPLVKKTLAKAPVKKPTAKAPTNKTPAKKIVKAPAKKVPAKKPAPKPVAKKKKR
jgi:tRNA nucleotidyltransferase (CCA-adding enzyme)